MDSPYIYVWEFTVAADMQPEFERHYGPAGSWVRLFRRAAGYAGTTLLKDRVVAGRYLTIDRWDSEAAYRRFRADSAIEYAALDRECEGLTRSERALGEFSA